MKERRNFDILCDVRDVATRDFIIETLEGAGYKATLSAPGNNFVIDSLNVDFCIAVMTQNFLDHLLSYPTWTYYFTLDPTGSNGILVAVKAGPCNPSGLFRTMQMIDIVDLDDDTARQCLLEGVSHQRTKPQQSPRFPG